MKKFQQFMIAVALCVVMSNPAMAETKVGVVNTLRLLEEAPQAKSAQSDIETEFAPREKELLSLQKSIRKQEDKLGRDSAVMSEKARTKLERDILSKQREFKRTQDEFRDDLNIRKNEVLSRLQRQIQDAIVSMAKEKKYDVILGQGVVYSNKSVDVTDMVLEKLGSQFKKSK